MTNARREDFCVEQGHVSLYGDSVRKGTIDFLLFYDEEVRV